MTGFLQQVAIISLEETSEAREVEGVLWLYWYWWWWRQQLRASGWRLRKVSRAQVCRDSVTDQPAGENGHMGHSASSCQDSHQPLYTWGTSACQMSAGNATKQRGSIQEVPGVCGREHPYTTGKWAYQRRCSSGPVVCEQRKMGDGLLSGYQEQ